jgi:hypothetical protein
MENNTITAIDLARKIMHFVITDQSGKVLKRFKTTRDEFLFEISKLDPESEAFENKGR